MLGGFLPAVLVFFVFRGGLPGGFRFGLQLLCAGALGQRFAKGYDPGYKCRYSSDYGSDRVCRHRCIPKPLRGRSRFRGYRLGEDDGSGLLLQRDLYLLQGIQCGGGDDDLLHRGFQFLVLDAKELRCALPKGVGRCYATYGLHKPVEVLRQRSSGVDLRVHLLLGFAQVLCFLGKRFVFLRPSLSGGGQLVQLVRDLAQFLREGFPGNGVVADAALVIPVGGLGFFEFGVDRVDVLLHLHAERTLADFFRELAVLRLHVVQLGRELIEAAFRLVLGFDVVGDLTLQLRRLGIDGFNLRSIGDVCLSAFLGG